MAPTPCRARFPWRQRGNPTNQICRRKSPCKRVCLRRGARGSATHRHSDLPDSARPSSKGRARNPGQEMGCQPLIQCRLPSRRHHWAGSQTRRTTSATYIINKHLTLTIAHQPRKLNPRESHPNQQSANSPPTSSLALTENGDDDNNNNNNKPTPRKQRKKRRTPSGDERKRKKDDQNNPPRNMPLQSPLLLLPAPPALRPPPQGLLLPLHLLPARHWRAALVRRRLARPCG